jgi:hypothetical protein
MKAYKVSNYEGYGEIVFAESPGQAKAHVSALDNDFLELSAKRAPEFDSYINQEITPEILLQHGWWFECNKCGQAVYQDEAKVIDGKVYCSSHSKDDSQ